MSSVTKPLHRTNYPSIDAASPSQSQAGRKILITSSSAVVGRAAAAGFVTAGADTVVVTSRSAEKALTVAMGLEVAGKGNTKVVGYQYEIADGGSVNKLWDCLERDRIQIDTLILNATENVPNAQEYEPSISQFFHAFESGVKNQIINVQRFQKQGAKKGKVLIYISTNAIHFNELSEYYLPVGSSRIAMTRTLQDLAGFTPVDQMQILNRHPGFIPTPSNAAHGYGKDSLPFDDPSLPGNVLVWASIAQARFLHGRFAWSDWDVDELVVGMRGRIEGDRGFLKVGLQGVESQSFEALFEGMGRSV